MKIVLIGFMGAGKSSVAKEIGHQLQLPILEMDDLASKKTNSQNMLDLFAKGGEALLRQTEMSIAQEYSIVERIVISTGGGVILNPITMDHLKKSNGKVYFLNASFPMIAQRLDKDKSRPLFKNKTAAKALYHARQPLYLKYADHIINVDGKSIEVIAREVVNSSLIR